MPQFPHSKYTVSPSSGILVRNQGSHSPMVEAEEPQGPETVRHPFRVYTKKASSGFDVYVMPGTANNRMVKIESDYLDKTVAPKINFSTFSSTGKKIVALKVTYSTATFFPEASEIVLVDDEESLTDSNTIGYLQIASITGTSTGGKVKITAVNQFIFSSQVVVRAKPGSGTAVWSFVSR